MVAFHVKIAMAVGCLLTMMNTVGAQTTTGPCCSSDMRACNKAPKTYTACMANHPQNTFFPAGIPYDTRTCIRSGSTCARNSDCCGYFICEGTSSSITDRRCRAPFGGCNAFTASGATACRGTTSCMFNGTVCVPKFNATFWDDAAKPVTLGGCCSEDHLTCSREDNIVTVEQCKAKDDTNVWLPDGPGPANNAQTCIPFKKSNDCAKHTDCCGMLLCGKEREKKTTRCVHPTDLCTGYTKAGKTECSLTPGCRWSSGRCIASFDASLYNATLKNSLAQPVLPARQASGNPDFLGMCTGYVASAYGDPHISSFDRRTYNCQGTGAFVLAKAPGKLEIQGIFDKPSTSSKVTVVKGVAIDYPALADVPTIQVSLANNAVAGQPTTYPISSGCSAYIYLDGVKQPAARGQQISNGATYFIELSKDGSVNIQFFDTTSDPPVPITSLRIRGTGSPSSTFGCFMNVQACLPLSQTALRAETVGLFGTPNGDREDEWKTATGAVLPIVSSGNASYAYCTTNHCVNTEAASLFVYEEKTFQQLNGCSAPFPGDLNISAAPKAIVDICGTDEQCLTEGMAGGAAEATRNLQEAELIGEIITTPALVEDVKFNITLPPPGCCSTDHLSCTKKSYLNTKAACFRNKETNMWFPDRETPKGGCNSLLNGADCTKNENCCGNLVCSPKPGNAQLKCVHPLQTCKGFTPQARCTDAPGCKWEGGSCMPSFDTSIFNATIKAALRQPIIVKTPLQGNADFLGLCKGYVASMHGDPHFSSFDRRTYNCMGNGTFVLAKSPGKLEIQGFFERAGPITATANKGVVIDYPALPSVPRIQINIAPNAVKALPTTYMINDVCSSHIFLDGILQTATRNTHISNDGSYAMLLNADGGIDIQFFDTTTTPPKNVTAVRVRVTGSPTGTWGCMMNIQACLPLNEPELLKSTTGLLGTPNGNRDDDWTTPTGQVVPIVSTASESYKYCTTHHCVRKESDSLFVHSENGVKPFNEVYSCSSTYPGGEPDITNAPPEIVDICGGDPECLFEGMVGGPEDALNNLEEQQLITEIITASNLTANVTFNITMPPPDTCKWPKPGDNACPTDVRLLKAPATQLPIFTSSPINIIAQSGSNVTFNISNPFASSVQAVYYQFYADNSLTCLAKTQAASCMQPITVTAACETGRNPDHSEGTKFAIVDVWFVDNTTVDAADNATLAECCQPDASHVSMKKALFTYVITCESTCPETTSRRLRGFHK